MIEVIDSLSSMHGDFDLLEIATRVAISFIPFLFSLCFHEYAHGWVARLKGDRTAEVMGRLTMNPLAHMDPIGTFILPILGIITHIPLFGWAKPVPVDARNMKNPRTDMFWVASAGPLSNLLLAVIGCFSLVLVFHFLHSSEYFAALNQLLQVLIIVNLYLAFFNLIPLHPLDGGKILARFIPVSWNDKMEQHQNMTGLFLMILFLSGAIRYLAIPVEITFEFLINIAEKLVA